MARLTTSLFALFPQGKAGAGKIAIANAIPIKPTNWDRRDMTKRPRLVICFQPKRTAPAAVGEVDHKSGGKTHKEANPILDRQTGHEKQASKNRDDGGDGTARSAKGAS